MSDEELFDIRLVTSDGELNKVRAFWYAVYVEEMGRCKEEADHAARLLADPLDRIGDVLAAWQDGEVVGTVICTAAATGKLGDYETLYDMARLGAPHPNRTGIITRLMVAPEYRGGTLSLMLAAATFRHGTPRGIEYAFIDCNLYLVPFFEYLGYRHWRGPFEREGYGEVQIMLFDCFDVAHLDSIGSPLAQTARELADQYDTTRIAV